MRESETIAALRVSLASPEQIRSWSSGEVTAAATIAYPSEKPEPGGILCERIFGPTRNWSCFCGKYKRARQPGFRCEICGVELAPSAVRRQRMGHIELVAPIAHPWFREAISLLLGLSKTQLTTILSYAGYLVTAIDEQARKHALATIGQVDTECQRRASTLEGVQVGDVLDNFLSSTLLTAFGRVFSAGTGAEIVREQLSHLDLDALARLLRQQMPDDPQNSTHTIKRLHVVEAFRTSGLDPAWMVLTVLPVLPPDLRPLLKLDNGTYATSDLNTLYERIIYRNNRIKRFLEAEAPAIMLNNEKRLLQEACAALLDNKHKRTPASGTHGPLKSLTDALEGKEGRLRRNLLGKRVDYSGRSVIVGDPTLRLHQCGLPTKICLELFKPFVIRRLLEKNYAGTARAAKRLIEYKHPDPILWDVLEEVMCEKVVLLNRAPTLHRLSIQAFAAKRVEGLAIRLHPLVCSAFNADFDGDQMAVHLPLSDAAQAEARTLMLSTATLRSPATGEPSISLSQEIVLGLFYLTQARPSTKRAGRIFADATEALLAWEHGIIDLHTPITVRLPVSLVCDDPPPAAGLPLPRHRRLATTAGRLIFNDALPKSLRYKNYEMTKERLKLLVAECLQQCGTQETAGMADRLKTLGFRTATKSGISFAISDIHVPPEKHAIVAEAQTAGGEIDDQMRQGIITDEERRRQLIALWTQATEQISKHLEEHLDPWGSLATIIKSGATKAKFQQIRQLSGIRGLMASPSGQIIPIPVTGNYLEGLAVWMIFIAASGARKGFMDRSLNTARSGYLTRKLVEAGMEVWISEEDCGTTEGLRLSHAECAALGLPDMKSRITGRVLAEGMPTAGLPAGTLLDEALVHELLAAGITSVTVRSPLTCQSRIGICRRCYGSDLATGRLVRIGTAVGVIAGQSIGEPGTQLTMRTFHSGGIANAQGDITQGLPRVEELFEAKRPRNAAPISEIAGHVELIQQTERGEWGVRIVGESAERIYTLPAGREVLVAAGQVIAAGTPLCIGSLPPRELLAVAGPQAVGRYLVNEVQRVYRSTGVFISDKHVEVIVRQMLRYALIEEEGDSSLLPGQVVERMALVDGNSALLAQGGSPAVGRSVLFGLTKTVLQTSSWVAAASFQETSRVIAASAIRGQRDPLCGLKEKLLIGRRIPAPFDPLALQQPVQREPQEARQIGSNRYR